MSGLHDMISLMSKYGTELIIDCTVGIATKTGPKKLIFSKQ